MRGHVSTVQPAPPTDSYRFVVKVNHLSSCSQLVDKGRRCRQKHNRRKTADKGEKEAPSEKRSEGREGGTNGVKDRQTEGGEEALVAVSPGQGVV